MIVVRLLGGLGNQMFQYAAGLSLARRLDVEFALDLRAFERYRLRDFALGRCRVRAGTARRQDLLRWPLFAGPVVRRYSQLGRILDWYVPPLLGFDPRWLDLQDGTLLDGYFQMERYFESVGDVLLGEFQPIAPLSPASRALVDEMRGTNSTAVHVRRGDYVTNPHASRVHGVCSISYYEGAVRSLRESGGDRKLFVFSDDPQWVRSSMDLGGQVSYVEGNKEQPELDLHLMSHCRDFIISNSTFSWWAAWLGTRRSGAGQVIAPDPWFADTTLQPEGLLPGHWRLLPR